MRVKKLTQKNSKNELTGCGRNQLDSKVEKKGM